MSEKVCELPDGNREVQYVSTVEVLPLVDKVNDCEVSESKPDAVDTETAPKDEIVQSEAEYEVTENRTTAPLRLSKKRDHESHTQYDFTVKNNIESEYRGCTIEKMKSVLDSNRLIVNGIERDGIRMDVYEETDWIKVRFSDIDKTVRFHLDMDCRVHTIVPYHRENIIYCIDAEYDATPDATVTTMDEVVATFANIKPESDARKIVEGTLREIVRQEDNQAQLHYNYILLRHIEMTQREDDKRKKWDEERERIANTSPGTPTEPEPASEDSEIISEEEMVKAYKLFNETYGCDEYPSFGLRIKEVHSNTGHFIYMHGVYIDEKKQQYESNDAVFIKYEDIFLDMGSHKALEIKKGQLTNLILRMCDGKVIKSADGKNDLIRNKAARKTAVKDYVAFIFLNMSGYLGNAFKKGHRVWELKTPTTYYIPSDNYTLRTKALAEKVVNDLGVISTVDGIMFTYENGVYVRDVGEKKIRAHIDYILGNDTREQARREVIAYTCNKYVVEVEELVGNSEIVNFRNGYYDLRDKQFKPHDKSFKTVFQLNADYIADGSAACPNITQFLIDILPDERYRNIVLDYLAYCLIPDTTLQKALFMLGAGSNGKTKLLELLRKLIGKSAYSSMSIHQLEKDRFSPIRLMTKLLNICGDMPTGKLNECQVFKNVTGGDSISGEAKNKDGIDFEPKTKFLLSMNHCPVVNESTDIGYFRRIILIRFTRNFEKEVDVNGKPIKDAGIMKRLTTPEELSGFMHMLIGRLQLMHDRAIESSSGYVIDGLDSDEVTRKRYSTNSFPERQFCDDVIISDSTSFITLNEAYTAYEMWCRECGEVIRKPRILIEAMRYNGFKTADNKQGESGMNIVWEGVHLNPDYDPEAKKNAETQKSFDIKAIMEKVEDDRKKKMELAYWNEYWKTANPTLVTYEYAPMMRGFYQNANGDSYPTKEQMRQSHLDMWNANHPDRQMDEYMPYMTEYVKNPEGYEKKWAEHRARCDGENAQRTAQALSLWNYLHPDTPKDTPDEDVWAVSRENQQLLVQALDLWNKTHQNATKYVPDEDVWSLYREMYR